MQASVDTSKEVGKKILLCRTKPWEPLPAQKRFLYSQKKYSIFLGGYGSGKSTALGMAMARAVCANPRRQGAILAPHYSTLSSTTLPIFMSFIPSPWVKKLNLVDKYIKFHNDTVVYYRSADNPSGYDGLNLTFAGVDEISLISRQAWITLEGRIRVPGNRLGVWAVGTPEAGWIEDVLDLEDAYVIFASTAENTHNDPTYIDTLRRSYSVEESDRLISGRIVHKNGLVYKDFNRDSVKDCSYDKSIGKLYVSVDFGYRNPHVLWIWQVNDGVEPVDIVIDELAPENIRPDDLAKAILANNDRMGYQVFGYVGDSAGLAAGQTGQSDIKIFSDAGIKIQTSKRWKEIRAGINLVRGRVKDMTGKRKLFVSDDMWRKYHNAPKAMKRGFVKDIMSYSYSDKHDDSVSCKGNEFSEHSMDCIRYYIMSRYSGAESGDFEPAIAASVPDSAWDRYGKDISDSLYSEDPWRDMAREQF